jgi:hypothetical protein
MGRRQLSVTSNLRSRIPFVFPTLLPSSFLQLSKLNFPSQLAVGPAKALFGMRAVAASRRPVCNQYPIYPARVRLRLRSEVVAGSKGPGLDLPQCHQNSGRSQMSGYPDVLWSTCWLQPDVLFLSPFQIYPVPLQTPVLAKAAYTGV